MTKWTEETIADLRILWEQGVSTAEIGRRLNVSKNSVVGKVHRLDLESRPSPILPGGRIAAPKAPKPPKITLPPLSEIDATMAVAARPIPPPRMAVPKPVFEAPKKVMRPPPPRGPTLPCCWPMGDPGTREFRYCDGPSEPQKPYCLAHCLVGYSHYRRPEYAEAEAV